MTGADEPSKTRILLFSEIFPPVHGGSGRWFSEIYSRFPEGSVVFLAGAHEKANEYDAGSVHKVYRENLSSSEWGVNSWTGLKFYWRQWRYLRKLVSREGITTVHCGRVLPEGLVALLLKLTSGIPYYCYVHGEDVEAAITSRELTWLTRRILNRAEKVISNSENTLRILTEKWDLEPSRVIVMNPGVDVRRFSPDQSTPIPSGWQGRTVILTVGRLQRRKGQDMMIQALPALLERWPDLLYAIIGDGDELPRLEALVDQYGLSNYVQFMGAVDDTQMVNAYRHCRLFALPNRRSGNDDEGFGMVLLEAQACGKPVLAGASGGTSETMIEGETGVLVDCTTPEPLQAALATLLESNENLDRMGRAARRHVEERFSWDNLTATAQQHWL